MKGIDSLIVVLLFNTIVFFFISIYSFLFSIDNANPEFLISSIFAFLGGCFLVYINYRLFKPKPGKSIWYMTMIFFVLTSIFSILFPFYVNQQLKPCPLCFGMIVLPMLAIGMFLPVLVLSGIVILMLLMKKKLFFIS